MWNVNIHSLHINRDTVLRALEIALYAIIGTLLVGQIFTADAVTLRESLMTAAGASLLMLVSTGSAPLVSLFTGGRVPEREERGRVLPFRSRKDSRQTQEETQRRAA